MSLLNIGRILEIGAQTRPSVVLMVSPPTGGKVKKHPPTHSEWDVNNVSFNF